MSYILTTKQKSVVHEVAQKWLRSEISTEPADRATAECALQRAYKLAGIEPPGTIIWLRSSVAGAIAAAAISEDTNIEFRNNAIELINRKEILESTTRGYKNIDFKIHDDLSSIDKKVWSKRSKCVWKHIYDYPKGEIHVNMSYDFKFKIEAELTPYFVSNRFNNVRSVVRRSVWMQMFNFLRCLHMEHISYVINGFLDTDLLEKDIFLQLGFNFSNITPLIDLESSVGWVWPFEDVAILTERPCGIHLDSQSRLHSDTGMAVEYLDGWGIYCLNGITCPPWIIEKPERLNPISIQDIPNVELRRVLIERFGMERYVRESGAKSVSTDEYGTLYRIDVRGDEPLTVVEVVNGTPEPDGEYRRYMLRVPPQINTAKEAVAWTYGMSPEEYELIVRT